MRRIAASLAILVSSLMVTSCGDKETTEQESGSEQESEQRSLNAADLKIERFDKVTRVGGTAINQLKSVARQSLNGSGGFDYPAVNSQFVGNLTLFVRASDEQGLRNIRLVFSGSEEALTICNGNCGTSFGAVVNGINPDLFGWESGQNALQLWIEDNSGNVEQVATLPLNWQVLTISGVTASIAASSGQLSVSWSSLTQALRYNVYVAHEPGHTGSNFNELDGGEARLGLTNLNATFDGKQPEQDYYILVTGVNGTGETAFSDEIVLIGGVAVNPPTANEDVFNVNEDGELTGDLLANDSPGGNTTFAIATTPITPPSLGELVINQNGTFTYTPRPDVNGQDQFTYQVTNSQGLTASAIVTINIIPVNDLPIASDDMATITGDTYSESAPGLLANVSDRDNADTLTISLQLVRLPRFGSLDFTSDGAFTYTKGENFVTYDSFAYQAFDGTSLSEPAEMLIKSPDFNGFPPIAVADLYFQVNEDEFLVVDVANGVGANDFDEDNSPDELTFSEEQTATHGELTLLSDGSFTYQPIADFNGVDFFRYSVEDPTGNRTSAQATITVLPQNDPPTAVEEQYVLTNSQAVHIGAAIGLLRNDTDVDGDSLTVNTSTWTQPSSGQLQVNADGSFTYTANEGFEGTDSFTYQASDGQLSSNVETVQLSIVGVHGTTDDESILQVDIAEALNSLPDDAEITNISVELGQVDISGTSITYTPPVGLNQIDVISVEISTSSGTAAFDLLIQVTSNNTPPSFSSNGPIQFDEHLTEGTLVYTAQATDEQGHDVNYFLDASEQRFEINSQSGEVRILDNSQLDYETSPTSTLTVYVQDIYTASSSQVVNITLNDIDEAPTLTSAKQFSIVENTANGTSIYQATATDPEGQSVTFNLTDSNGIFDIDAESGVITVSDNTHLDHEFVQSYQIVIVTSDGSQQNSHSVTVTISNVNEAPNITSGDAFNITENTANGSQAGYTATASDPENNSLSWSIDSDIHNIFTINASSGVITVADNTNLNYEFVQSYNLTIRATETNGVTSNLTVTKIVTVNIDNVDEQTDSDGDGLNDNVEVEIGTDPGDSDSDDDGLLDGDEVDRGTNPLDADSDDDTHSDGDEVAAGTDPLNPDTTPSAVSFINPINNATDVCTNQTITATFNEPLQAESIDSSDLILLVGETQVAGTLSLTTNDYELFFAPAEALPASSSFTIQINGVKDKAGNLMTQAFTSTFATGTCIESDRPTILARSPDNGANGMPQNTRVTVTINEPIDPTSVTSGSVYMIDQTTGQQVPGTRIISENKTQITFVPDGPLLVGRRHYTYFTSDIKDQFGNPLFFTSTYFDVAFASDETAPQIVSTSIEQGQTNLPTNAKLAVRFSERVNTQMLDGIKLVDSENVEVATTTSLSDNRQRVVLAPEQPLATSASYRFDIAGVSDSSGNAMESSQQLNFMTGEASDTETGTDALWSIPNNNTQNVPLNPVLKVTLSEPIDPTSVEPGSLYLWDNQTGRTVPTTIAMSEDNLTLSLSPKEPLHENRRYYFYVGYAPHLMDLAGNVVAQNRYRYFNTGDAVDTQAPQVVSTNIAEGFDNMPINGRLSLVLDQELSNACEIDMSATLTSDQTSIPITITLANDRKTLNIVSESPLSISTSYTLTISGLCDYAGNVLSNYTLSFSTNANESNDTTGPSLVSMTPVHQSTDASITTTIVLVYDEDVDLRSKPTVDGGGISIPGAYQVQGNTITFTPDLTLLGNTRYTIGLYHNVPDLVGNTNYGGTRYFDTQDVSDNTSPNVVAVSPANGSVDTNPDQSVVVTFDEPIGTGALNSKNLALYHNGSVLSTSISRSADGRNVTLSTSNLPQNALISVVINDAVTDLSGNALAPFVSSFTTGARDNDYTRPSIIKQVPANGSNGWINIRDIYFYTNEPMDSASLDGALHISENGQLIQVQTSIIGDGRTIKVSKSENFAEGALIQYFWNSKLTDVSHNPVYEFNGYFNMDTDVDEIGVRPYVTAYYPHGSSPGTPLNPVLMASFSENIDVNSLTDTNVTLENTTSGEQNIPVTYKLGVKPNVVEVRPVTPLTANNQYYLWFGVDIKDTDGDNLASNYATYFNTFEDSVSDNRAPMVSTMSPPTGEVNVGTLPFFSLRHDEQMNPLSFNQEGAIDVQFSETDSVVKYNYRAPLAPEAEHTETAPVMLDLAGNMSNSHSVTFTTASGPDFVSPSVRDTAYTNNQQGVALNPVFQWDFNEPIDPNSATSAGIYMWDDTLGQKIDSTFELSADGKRLTVIPSQELLVLRRYYQYAYNLHDLSGNGLGNHYRYVSTGTDRDEVAPTIIDTSINDGDQGLPTNLKLNIRFSEPLNPLNISGISLLDGQGQSVPINITLDRGRTLVKVTPKQLLTAFSAYQLNATGMTDLAGNAQANSLVLNFTTGATVDMTTGAVLHWSIPNNNTQNVPTNPLLQVTFNERIDAATVDADTFYLWEEGRNIRVPGTRSLSTDGRTLTFTPGRLLKENTRHYLYVGYSPYLTDLAANGVAINNYRYFTTGLASDNTAPVVIESNILTGNSVMPINGRIVLKLDEEVADACAMEQGVSVTSSSGEHEINADLGSDRRTVTITSTTSFDPATTYTITINGVCDYAGNQISNFTFNFTTSQNTSADTSGPSLVSITPAHQSTDVATNLSSIVMVYDEPVDLRSAPPVTGGTITVPGSYSVSNDTITFTPEISLLPDTRYTVGLYNNVPDLAGNTVYGGTKYFNTVVEAETTAPTVAAITPASGASDVDPSKPVVITFSEPMTTSSLNTSNVTLYHNGNRISPSISRSLDGQVVTLNANLPQNALISVILNDAVTDLSGNSLSPFVSSFTTGVLNNDHSRPSISQQIPSNGASNLVDLDTIVFYVNEPLDPASLEGGLTIEEDGVLTTAELNLLGDNRTLTLTKSGGFTAGKRTTFYLSNLTDMSGNLLFDYNGSIHMSATPDGVGVKPNATAYYPASGTKGTPLNPVLMARFSEPLDATSLSDTRVRLTNNTDGGTELAVTYSLDSSGHVIKVVPDAPLETEKQYYLWFSREILDTDGDQLATDYATYFNTFSDSVNDTARPNVLAFSPPQSGTEIGTVAQFSLRFDEPMNSLTLDTATNNKMNVQFSEDNKVVSYNHRLPLPASAEHTESMVEMTDLAGNLVVSASTTFNTANGPDFVGPGLVDTALFNNQQDVPTNPVIEWVFNEPINLVSVTDSGVYMYNDSTNQTIGSSWELSSDGLRLTLMPDEALASGIRHYAYAYSLRDLSGNGLGNHYRYFTVGTAADETPPVIESTTVFEGQTQVPTNVKLKVRFNEILNPIPPTSITLLDSSSQSVPINTSLTRERMLLNITPKQVLQPNASYTLQVSGMKDISGNVQETPLSINFTTGPTVDLSTSGVRTWSIPVNNTQDVPLNPLLQVTFHERVDRTTVDSGSFYLYSEGTNAKVPGSWTLSSDGLTLTFTPDALLEANVRHYLYVGYSPNLTDMAGNLIAQNNYRYFTTGTVEDTTNPSVSQTSIFDGSADMPINGRVVLEMDGPISDACLYTEGIELKVGATSVPIEVTLGNNRSTISISGQSNFAANTQHDLSIINLCDYAGNQISGSVLSFTTLDSQTEDTSAPTVVSISPANNATDVAISSNVVIQYNEPVDARSAPPIKTGGTAVTGSYNVVGDTITFTPAAPLANGTVYEIELFHNVPDHAGRTTSGGKTSFTTIE